MYTKLNCMYILTIFINNIFKNQYRIIMYKSVYMTFKYILENVKFTKCN